MFFKVIVEEMVKTYVWLQNFSHKKTSILLSSGVTDTGISTPSSPGDVFRWETEVYICQLFAPFFQVPCFTHS